jgi:hypothetical protein
MIAAREENGLNEMRLRNVVDHGYRYVMLTPCKEEPPSSAPRCGIETVYLLFTLDENDEVSKRLFYQKT